MHAFKDAAGREWPVWIDIAALRRVRAEASADLVEAVTGDLWLRLLADPVLLADVLWPIVRTSAEAQGVAREEFDAALVGQAIEEADGALHGALLDFFPPRQRAVAAAALLAAIETAQAELEKARASLASLAPPSMSGGSSPSAPESPDLTPPP